MTKAGKLGLWETQTWRPAAECQGSTQACACVFSSDLKYFIVRVRARINAFGFGRQQPVRQRANRRRHYPSFVCVFQSRWEVYCYH